MVLISGFFLLFAVALNAGEPIKPLSNLNLEGFQEAVDPFIQEENELEGKKPKLTVVVVGHKDAAALINGKMVRVKDKIGGSDVLSIKVGEVLLKDRYKLFRLKLDVRKPKTIAAGFYDVQLKDAPLGDVIKLLAMMQNKNVVMPSKLEDLVNASFPEVTLQAAMQAVLESRDLTSHEKNDVIRIMTRKDQEALGGDLNTRTFTLKYAKAKDIKEQAAQLVSARGTVMVDERTNTLTMRDTANYVKNMESYIESIDFVDRQVLIEARIVEASTGFVQSFGIKWGVKIDASGIKMNGVPGINNNTSNTAGTGGTGSAPITGTTGTGTSATPGLTGANYINTTRAANPLAAVAIGIPFSSSNLDLELSAAENNNKLTVLSRPSIMTMNNQPATIHSGKKVFMQIPGQVGLNPNGQLGAVNNLQNISAGITMVVTPQITIDGKIRLNIDVTSSQFNEATIGTASMQITDNNAKTQVLLNDGETTVLGGLYQATKSNAKGGIPFLSRIPLIGALFRNSTDADDKRELLVFIKPKIVDQAVKELDRSEKEPPKNVL
jgi:type IV pilus assembly protein PilQ